MPKGIVFHYLHHRQQQKLQRKHYQSRDRRYKACAYAFFRSVQPGYGGYALLFSSRSGYALSPLQKLVCGYAEKLAQCDYLGYFRRRVVQLPF